MASAALHQRRVPADRAVVCAALLHGIFTMAAISLAYDGGAATRIAIAVLLGLAMCWASNTISHIHLHTPVFRNAMANRMFSLYLSLVLTVPQQWWRSRHLAHHGLRSSEDGPPSSVWSRAANAAELAAVVVMLTAVAAGAPALFSTVIVPALVVGYGLCALQGREEHVRSDAGVDHHGRLYNALWFNDGYHAAHHRRPDAHWSQVVTFAHAADVTSRWPPILRPIEEVPGLWNRALGHVLDKFERLAMRIRWTRDFQLRRHALAFAAVISPATRPLLSKVTVVGGALFPRSVLALAPLLPDARFHIVDQHASHIEAARAVLSQSGLLDRVSFEHGTFAPDRLDACDLLVVPLAFRGDRNPFYAAPPAPRVAVHDWLWHRRGQATAIVSVLLVKRINVITTL